MDLRPNYRSWTADQHDRAQRQHIDRVGSAYAGWRYTRARTGWARPVGAIVVALAIAAVFVLR